MKKFYLFLVSIFFLNVFSLNAQNTDGTDFWVTFGGNYLSAMQTYDKVDLQIRIANRNQYNTVYLHYTNLGITDTLYLAPQEVVTPPLDNFRKQAVYNTSTTTNNKSIHITSDSPITAYAMNQFLHSTDATNILPITALGKEYYHISYTPRANARDAYAVVATEDGTVVYHGNEPTPHILNAGDVYYRTSSGTGPGTGSNPVNINDMTGTRILASHPVAYFALNQNVLIPAVNPNIGGSGDCLMQQLAPVNTWGKNFFVPVSNVTATNKDRVRIVASKPNTTITLQPSIPLITNVGGRPDLTINAGQFIEFDVSLVNNGCYIQPPEPIGVCTYLTSANYNSGGVEPPSDPSQAWLPSIEQAASDALIAPFVPSTTYTDLATHKALLITPAGSEDKTLVSISGSSPPDSLPGGIAWRTNAAAGMSFCSMPLQNNGSLTYRFSNPDGIIVLGYGYGYAEGYYYLGYSAMRNLDVAFWANNIHYQDLSNDIYCNNNHFEFTAEFTEPENLDSVKWYIDDELQPLPLQYEPWDHTFSIGEHEIKLEICYQDGIRYCITPLHIGGEIAASSSTPADWGTISGAGCYALGANATLIAAPAQNYKFINWTENNVVVSTNDTLKVSVNSDRAFFAKFEPNFCDITVFAEPLEGGKVCCDSTEIIYNELITVTATANSHYTFSNWAENGAWISDEETYTFNVTKNRNLTAIFDIETFNIYVDENPEDGGMAYGGGNDIPYGAETTVWAEPFLNYIFLYWTNEIGEVVYTEPSYTFTVEESMTLTANFKLKEYSVKLSANPPTGGTVAGGGDHFTHGTQITVSAIPNSKYRFVNWTEDGKEVSKNADFQFTVTRSRVLVANFELKTFDIYVDVNPTGAGCTACCGGNYIPYGTLMTVNAYPGTNHTFVNWTHQDGSEASVDEEYTFNVFQSDTLTANFEPKEYTIRAFANPASGGTVSGGGTFAFNAEATVTANVNADYHFAGWTEGLGGPVVSNDLAYSFPVTRDRDLYANFELNGYNITLEANPPYAGTVGGGGLDILFGTEITVTATATDACFHFVSWTENGIVKSVDPNYFFAVSESWHLVANFSSDPFNIVLSANPTGGGTVEGDGTFNCGETITITATAEEGYTFMYWMEDDVIVSPDAIYTFTLEAPRNLVAHFDQKTIEIALSAEPTAGGTVSGSGTDIPCGNEVVLEATADDCYTFINWTENDVEVSIDPVYTFTPFEDHTFVAHFAIKTFNIEASAAPTAGGSVSEDETEIPCGTEVTFVATPDDCYTFVNWTENGTEVSTDASYTFTVTDDRTLVANFEIKTFDIILLGTEGGTAEGDGTFNCGTEITVTATAEECYTFVNWTENGTEVSTDASYTFTVTDDRTLAANFEMIPYNITLSAEPEEGGTVSDDLENILCGTMVTVEATPDDCYTFVNWTENGTEVSTDASYNFEVTEDRVLVAHFEVITYDISASADPEEGGSISGEGTYNCGEEITLTAHADGCYTFIKWTENDVEVFTDASYTFTVNNDRILVAHFELNTHNIAVEAVPITGGMVSGFDYDVPCGEERTVIAIPFTDYVFVNWTNIQGQIVSLMDTFTFNVTGDTLLFANFILKSYFIKLTPSPLGGGSVVGGGTYSHGEVITVTATPYAIYKFVNWTEAGEEVSTDSAYTFTVTRSRDLVANFELKTLDIYLDVNPPDGGIAVGGGNDIPFGTLITVTAIANSDYVFLNWTENGIEQCVDADYTFNVTKSRLLIANFKHKNLTVKVFANTPAGGQVSGGATNIPYGEEITVSANVNENYHFGGWWEEDEHVSDSLNYTFPVTRSRDLTALFLLNEYDITLEPYPSHGGTVDGGGLGIIYGTDITVTATANDFFHFEHWTENGIVKSVDANYDFTVTANRHLVAVFSSETFDVTLSADPSDGGTLSGGGTDIPYLTEVTISASPDDCYIFVSWTEADTVVSTNPDYTFILTADREFVAHFVKKNFMVTASVNPPEGGTVSIDTAYVDCREEITIIATPNIGYRFINWTKDGDVVWNNEIYTFPVMDTTHVVANFVYETHTITLLPQPYEGGQAITSGEYPLGMALTVHAIANPEFEFIEWTEDDIQVSQDTAYTFIVERDRFLVAHFDTARLNVTLAAFPEYGGIVEGDSTNITYGDIITVVATPNPQFDFAYWKEGATIASFDSAYTFPVNRSRHLVAHFTPKLNTINLTANPEDGGELEGGGIYDYGTSITVKAFPYSNYTFKNWTEDSVMVSDDAFYSFTVLKPRELVANFTPKNYAITLTPSPYDWGTVSGAGSYAYQEMITVKAYPNYLRDFVGWIEADTIVSVDTAYTFPVTRDRDLIAKFAIATYNIELAANPEPGGTVLGAGVHIPFGVDTTVTAVANPYYTFVNWTEDTLVVSIDAAYSFVVTKSRSLVANFISVTHEIILLTNLSEGGTVTGEGVYDHGTEITISAIPYECYDFLYWMEKDSIISNSEDFTFLVEADHTFKAYFVKRIINISTAANPTNGGTTTGDLTNVVCGDTITVSTFAHEEYNFINWTEDGEEVSTEEEYSFPAFFSRHLVANFVANNYYITLLADPPEMGTVSEGGETPYGTEFTASAYPNIGSDFLYWTEDSMVVSTDKNYTFTVERARTLVAHFEKERLVVNAEVNDSVYGYTTGSGKYDLFETAQLNAIANEGYRFSGWTKGNELVSTENIYEFVVTESVTLVANFYGIDFDTYVTTLWDNTFMLNLNKLANEDYDVVGCRWFKNGTEELETNTIDEFSYSAGPSKYDLLELAPTYYSYQLILKNGMRLSSTIKILHKYQFEHDPPPYKSLFVYPNPVFSGTPFTLEGVTKESLIEIYNQYGVCVSRATATDEKAIFTLDLPVGVYIIRNQNKAIRVTIIK
jgi:hypothetical protein